MADYTSSNTGAVIDAAVDYVEILDNYLTISSNELIITGQTGVGSDTVLLNLKANNSAGFAGNVLRFTDTDPTAVQNGSMGKIQWFSTGTGAVVAEINGKNDDATPDGQLIISTAAGASLAQRIDINADGDIQFFNAAGNSRDLHWDATDSRLGINVTTPTEALDVLGNANFTGTVTADGLTVDGNATIDGASGIPLTLDADAGANTNLQFSENGALRWYLRSVTSSNDFNFYGNSQNRLNIGSGGDISFYDTSGNAKFFWDAAAESLGIGVSPSSELHVKGADETQVYIEAPAGSNAGIRLLENGTSKWTIGNDQSNDGLFFYDFTASEERMRIQSGNVGIGTNSPSYRLDVQDASDPAQIRLKQDGNTNGFIFKNFNGNEAQLVNADNGPMVFKTNDTERMRIDSSGRVGINRTPSISNSKLEVGGADNVPLINVEASGVTGGMGIGSTGLQFFHGSTAHMRLDSSGNLLVGTTNNSPVGNNVVGVGLFPNGSAQLSRDGGTALLLNRKTSDGSIIDLRKDGTTVGSIGTYSSGIYIATTDGTDSGLGFRSTQVVPCTTTGANRDNAIDLGASGSRFDDIFATNGTIQTSDRNEKQDIAELSDAEQRVAVAAKGLLRKFRWKSSVEEKGDDARIHFGIIAQDLQDAFTAEGLDAGRYAMFILSTWTDEETGEEHTRLGVRYSELLAFIISAI